MEPPATIAAPSVTRASALPAAGVLGAGTLAPGRAARRARNGGGAGPRERRRGARPGSGRWIAGPVIDLVFFVFSPLWAVAAGWWMTGPFWSQRVEVLDARVSLAVLVYMTLTQAHLTVGFVRSHLDGDVFRRFPRRFVLGPLVLLVAVCSSDWIWTAAFVLMIFWDVYHSAMQTFGLGRIYDVKAGNDPELGRRLDVVANLLLYAGPILGGAMLMSHVDAFHEFDGLPDVALGEWTLSSSLFTAVPPFVAGSTETLRLAVLAFTAVFSAVYVLRYRDLRRAGYRLPWQKVCLLASTGLAALFAWGFNSFGMAYLIMNVFHAVQYFALVWISEGAMLRRRFVGDRGPWAVVAVFAAFLALPATAGLYLYAADGFAVRTALMACALLHFWFDGFMWSVRKQQAV